MSVRYMYKGKKPVAIEWLPKWFSRDETTNMIILCSVGASVIATAIVWVKLNETPS